MKFAPQNLPSALLAALAALAGLGLGCVLRSGSEPEPVAARVLPDAAPPRAEVPPSVGADAKAAAIRLVAAAREKDYFGRAEKTCSAIEQLTAADFAEFVAARNVPLPLAGPNASAFEAAIADAFVERWLAVDPQGAIPAIVGLLQRDADGKRAGGAKALAQAFARLQPAAFLTERAKLPAEETAATADWPFDLALRALGRTQPEAARRFAAEFPKDKRVDADFAVAVGLAESDPVAALQSCEQFSISRNTLPIIDAAVRSAERAGPGVVREVLEKCPEQLGGDYLDILRARYPEFAAGHGSDTYYERPNVIAGMRTVFDSFSAAELQKRLGEIPELQEGSRARVVGQLVEAWAIQDPPAAAAWALAQAGAEIKPAAFAPVQKAFAVWREQDLPAALAWLDGLPASVQKSALANRAALFLMQRGNLDAALALYSPPVENYWRETGHLRVGLEGLTGLDPSIREVEYLAVAAFPRDPARTVDWLAALPADAAHGGYFLPLVFAHWAGQEPELAAARAEALPADSLRDEAFSAMAGAVVRRDFSQAGEWVEKIANPATKAATIRDLYERVATYDPPGAREWLRAQPGLSAEEKEKTIRGNR